MEASSGDNEELNSPAGQQETGLMRSGRGSIIPDQLNAMSVTLDPGKKGTLASIGFRNITIFV
jgi:hypothetical protein